MAQIVLLTRDLLFGSKVEGMIREAGFEPIVVTDADQALAQATDASLLIVDLTADEFDGTKVVSDRIPTFGFYAHTDDETRKRALEAGFVKVVPRSRMMREGPALITDAAS